MKYNFEQVIDRRGTNCVKFDCAAQFGYSEDILPLWVADMDFQAPECVRKALSAAVEHGIFGYSFPGEAYYRAVQGWFAERFGWQTEKEWIVTTPGVVFALSTAVRAATQPGDAVLVQPPVYYPFYRVVETNGRRLVSNPLVYEKGRYTVDFGDFEEKIVREQVKLFILCSPHNPVGRVWTEEELQKIGQICLRHGVKVVADEIHCDFTFPGHPHTPFLKACPEMAESAILCTAPSKSFNLAGLQVSNIFIPGEALREAFVRQMQICCYSDPNCLGMVACTAAYQSAGEWMDACVAYIRGNLEYMRAFLAERLPKIRLVEPEGTYLAWLDCSGLGLSKEALDDLIVHKANLWLDTGSLFGSSGEQFQRVVLACPRTVLETALEQLAQAVEAL